MPPFISYKPYRNEWWKGHVGITGVRAALRYSTKGLRIFELSDDGLGAKYTEIPRDQWCVRFGYLGD